VGRIASYPETRANFSKVPSGLALVKTLLSPIRICIDGVEIPVVLVVSPPLLNVSSILKYKKSLQSLE
jgi:hypothetical protein